MLFEKVQDEVLEKSMAVPDRLIHGMDKWWKVLTLISMNVVQRVTNAIDKVPRCLVSQHHPLNTNVCAFGYERLDRLLALRHKLQCSGEV